MGARDPDEIWDEAAVEGARRLHRSTAGLAATGAVGGVDVMLGVLALTVTSGALAAVLPEEVAHLGGSLVFGIGFVLLVVGRSELFTENFLVPVAALVRREARPPALARLWAVTMLANVAALLAVAAMLTRARVLEPAALDAAGALADTFARRDLVAAGLSAMLAGTAMTLMTWLVLAVDRDGARILVALLVGFLLAAPSLNHAVVSVGEMSFGLLAGTTEKATWTDLAQNLPVAIVGNLLGGLGFVTAMRLVQVRGEPGVDGA